MFVGGKGENGVMMLLKAVLSRFSIMARCRGRTPWHFNDVLTGLHLLNHAAQVQLSSWVIGGFNLGQHRLLQRDVSSFALES